MVAGEQEFVTVEIDHVAARVARRRDGEQSVRYHLWRIALDHLLNAEPRGAVGGVHHAPAAELRRELGVVSDIVAVREQHRPDTTEFPDAADERRVETRRIHQHVPALALRTLDEI